MCEGFECGWEKTPESIRNQAWAGDRFSLAACLSRSTKTEAASPKLLTQPSFPMRASFPPSDITRPPKFFPQGCFFLLTIIPSKDMLLMSCVNNLVYTSKSSTEIRAVAQRTVCQKRPACVRIRARWCWGLRGRPNQRPCLLTANGGSDELKGGGEAVIWER